MAHSIIGFLVPCHLLHFCERDSLSLLYSHPLDALYTDTDSSTSKMIDLDIPLSHHDFVTFQQLMHQYKEICLQNLQATGQSSLSIFIRPYRFHFPIQLSLPLPKCSCPYRARLPKFPIPIASLSTHLAKSRKSSVCQTTQTVGNIK